MYHNLSGKGGLAKLFWSGRSQAVRLPKEYRFDGKEVRIRREGAMVILEPIGDDGAWIDAIAGMWDADAAAAALDRPGPDSYEKRDFDFEQ